ncbi:MAG: TnpV protein [Clostridiales bacterium]|nr:TnpV protein [Clostridiales bacterium]
MRELKPLEPGEIEERAFSMDDEEYNQLLDDIEKLSSGDEPVVVDGILFGTFGDGSDDEEPKPLPKPDYDYPLSYWYGKARKEFLKDVLDEDYYIFLRNTGRLQFHLIDIDKQAKETEERLTEEYKKLEGVTEELKMRDQLGWVGRVNSIRNRVREVIQHDLIFVVPERTKLLDTEHKML